MAAWTADTALGAPRERRPRNRFPAMTFAVTGSHDDVGGPSGYTYGGLIIRVGVEPTSPTASSDGGGISRERVLQGLAEARFSGWLGPVEDGWVVAVPLDAAGPVAGNRRGVLSSAAWLAEELATTVLAVRVVRDRQLALAAWTGATEHGRYVSDPSFGREDARHLLDEPVGAEHAEAFARACGRASSGREVKRILGEQLDHDSVLESERLIRVLRLLGLPEWLVSVDSLPRNVPAGPRAEQFTRLGAGSSGLAGRLRGWGTGVVRRRRRTEPELPAPVPRYDDIDPWLM